MNSTIRRPDSAEGCHPVTSSPAVCRPTPGVGVTKPPSESPSPRRPEVGEVVSITAPGMLRRVWGGKSAFVVSCYTMGLGVIRSLGERGVPLVGVSFDKRDIAQHSRYVVEKAHVPDPARHEAEFVDALAELGTRRPGSLLVPAHDAALVAIARNASVLSESFVVATPPWPAVEQSIDKAATYRHARAIGVATPMVRSVSDPADVPAILDELGLPVLVKPSVSHVFVARFGKKMIAAPTVEEARRLVEMVLAEGIDVMLAEIIPGPPPNGANYNAYLVDGSPVAEFTGRKLRNSPSKWGSPRVVVSERIPEIIEPGRKLLSSLGVEGFANTEWKLDQRDGVWKLMEINARHNLSSMLAVRCGVDFPWIEYQHRLTGELPERPPTFEEGRYWIDAVRDAGTTLGSWQSEDFGVRDYVRPYLSRHTGAHWAWNDPMPGLARGWDAIRRGRRSR